MEFGHKLKSLASAASTIAVLWGAAGAAQARDVVWSVGVGSPGIHVGVSNAPPVVLARPIVVAPQAVYQHPHLYRYPQLVVMAPQPYFYAPSAWAPPGHRPGWRARHDDRRDRWEHRYDRRDRGFDRHDHR